MSGGAGLADENKGPVMGLKLRLQSKGNKMKSGMKK